MTANTNVTNQIKTTGRIISVKLRKDRRANIVVHTKSRKDAYIKFICDPSLLDGIQIRSHVKITGHLSSYGGKDVESGKYSTTQFFVVDEIKKAKTLTEDVYGIEGKFYEQPSSAVYIRGKVSYIKDDGEWIRYAVKVGGTKVMAFLNLKKLERMPDIKIGTEICTVCSVSTPVKNFDGKNVYYEDLIISDIAVC